MNLYYLSESDMDDKILESRVNFYTSISRCVKDLPEDCDGKEYYIYIPSHRKMPIFISERDNEERFVNGPIKLKFFTKIRISKNSNGLTWNWLYFSI